jgi:hypothetical protein
VEGVAKIALGLIFISIFIQMIKHGPAGATMWWRAKFLGQPSLGRP